MLWKFNGVYNADLLFADHARPVPYEMAPPPPIIPNTTLDPKSLYIHAPRGRRGRAIDDATERSAEHTSELQSLMRISYAVFCLTKQKSNHAQHTTINTT